MPENIAGDKQVRAGSLGSKEIKERKQLDRGATDDWEALKIMLDGVPVLKQRVLYKLKELMRFSQDSKVEKKISLKDQRERRLKSKQGKK